MSVERGIAVVVAWLCLGAGCQREVDAVAERIPTAALSVTAPATIDSVPAPKPEPSAAVEREYGESHDPDGAAVPKGPALASDRNATVETRERDVLALLSGGPTATRLPLDAVDPGKEFDPALRYKVVPWIASGGRHKTLSPRVRMGSTTVSGPLPKEVIQRTMRQNFGRFRLCYENGLSKDPNLQGRIDMHFVIDVDGTVTEARVAKRTLPDDAVARCMIEELRQLTFEKPDGKRVNVVYPISFEPG